MYSSLDDIACSGCGPRINIKPPSGSGEIESAPNAECNSEFIARRGSTFDHLCDLLSGGESIRLME